MARAMASSVPSGFRILTPLAPGTRTRMRLPCGPRSANGSPCVPCSNASNCGLELRILEDLARGQHAGHDFRETAERDADPGGTVGGFVADFISGFLQEEEVQQGGFRGFVLDP